MNKFTKFALLGVMSLLSTSAMADVQACIDPISVNPSEGNIADGDIVTITWEEPMQWVNDYANWDIYFEEIGGFGMQGYPAEEDGVTLSADGMTLEIKFVKGWMDAEGFRLVIPENLLVVASAPNLGNNAIQREYTSEGGGTVGGGISISLANEDLNADILTELASPIVFLVEPASAVLDPAVTPDAKIMDDNLNSYPVTVEEMFPGSNMGYWSVSWTDLPNPITAPGNYTIVLPEGLFTADGATSQLYMRGWMIQGNGGGGGDEPIEEGNPNPMSMYPEAGEYNVNEMGALEQIYLYFYGPVTVDNSVGATIYNVNDPSEVYTLTGEYNAAFEMVGEHMVILTLSEPIQAIGTYELNIPAGLIITALGTSDPITVTYEVVGGGGGVVGEIQLISILPSNENPIEKFAEDESFVAVVTEADQIGCMEGKLVNKNDPSDVIFMMRAFNRNEEGEFVSVPNPIDYILYEGNTYTLTLDCYDMENYQLRQLLGSVSVDYIGASVDNNKPSDVQLVSINPEPGSMMAVETREVTMTFSAPVEFVEGFATEGGQGARNCPITATAANDDHTVWMVSANKDFVADTFGEITYMVDFVDANGAIVLCGQDTRNLYDNWNPERGAMSTIAMRYDCIEAGVTVDIDPASGSTVTSLYEFTFTINDPAIQNAIGWGSASPNAVELLDSKGNRVAMGAEYQNEPLPEGTYDVPTTWVKLWLTEEITANGTYTLVIPWTCFTLGTEVTAKGYKGQIATYTIAGNGTVYDMEPVAVTPADNTEVEELSVITLTFDEEMYVNPTRAEGLLTNRTDAQLPGTFTVGADGKSILFTLDQPVTEDEIYFLTIAEGTFGTKAWGESDRTEGHANKGVTYTWTVKNESSIDTIVVGDNSEARYFDLQGRPVANPAAGTLVIRVIGGKAQKVLVR